MATDSNMRPSRYSALDREASALPRYIISLGSNRGYRGCPRPMVVIDKALAILAAEPRESWQWLGASRARYTEPLGPVQRDYVNALAMVASPHEPPALLERLQQIENSFARKRRQRWGARTLDLDIILWSGGSWSDSYVTIPHPQFRTRGFVLAALAEIAPHWSDPISGCTSRQLLARHKKSKAVDQSAFAL